jgi:hypothetical protein
MVLEIVDFAVCYAFLVPGSVKRPYVEEKQSVARVRGISPKMRV